jgi:EAL domain-containing protein (putative c-di-GMP-specific phosphodiesterase class I)
MFKAKRHGSGRVALANHTLIDSLGQQIQMEGELRDALADEALTLQYQPVLDARGWVLAAEALVRWPHPTRGLLLPAEFLPVAERGNLLRDLDRWVLRTALCQAATWPASAGRPVAVAVNLSALLPGHPEFAEAVAGAVAAAGIAWDRVILDLTEAALVDILTRTRDGMDGLIRHGVRFAVNDFGTGYSSLARLKDLPAQIIKVDRAFVAGIDDNATDSAVVAAIVNLTRATGRTCIAEGVERLSQFHTLRDIGPDAYQGWLFSPPVPDARLRQLLEQDHLHIPDTK